MIIFKLSISHKHNPSAYRAVFQRFGRLHIPEFLESNSSSLLRNRIQKCDSWSRIYTNSKINDAEISDTSSLVLKKENIKKLNRIIMPSGQDSVEFLFDSHPITVTNSTKIQKSSRFSDVVEFVNGSNFINFAQQLTGDGRICKCDALATRYLPGHYLTPHNDANHGENRLYAYVLNLTEYWRVEWGGILAFIDREDHIAEGYTPAFNSLNIFRVPQQHSVTMVSRLAGVPRLSITGWMHGS